ncbi:hypothetical protein TSA6c_36025 [Azospirillum sp. TSA6c]|uniref:hypothetical protein n=1 Tax=Azospirillum sp. TSA6c TaxID=709813 RepID=UPI000D60FDAF|nr:hypothetical protein [Azospirillum sp. TSA6c]PWC51189.1 hypothetical protein TSA6c_36025 [Azospirillum sp. TSA6c]
MFVSPFIEIRKGHKVHAQLISQVKSYGTRVFINGMDGKTTAMAECASDEEAEESAQRIMEQIESWMSSNHKSNK